MLPPTTNGYTTLFPNSFPLNAKKPRTFPTLWTQPLYELDTPTTCKVVVTHSHYTYSSCNNNRALSFLLRRSGGKCKGTHLKHHHVSRVGDHSIIIIGADNTRLDIFQWGFNGVQNFHCSWNACKENPNPNICEEQHVVPSISSYKLWGILIGYWKRPN